MSDIFENLLKISEDAIPSVGEIVRAKIIELSKKEIRFELPKFRTGVVRGFELASDPRFLEGLKAGDELDVRVLELDNENGEVELAFAGSASGSAWDKFKSFQEKGEILDVEISDANKGGLIIRLDNIDGFMPVSQLKPENYPRVSGGDKNKIFEKLKSLVGKKIKVKVITASPQENKLIFSEKAVWEDEVKSEISKYKISDIVEAKITALADFGAFVRFDNLEGLVHISEIAWQRLDHPSDVLKVGETIKAKILEISGSKIFLSIKALTDDPWKNIGDKFKVGDRVAGKVAKINPFGFIVELTPEIFGLAHVSELSSANAEPAKVAKVGDTLEFKIVSIEPEYHRLGLSLKALEEKTEEQKNTETEKQKNEGTEKQRNIETEEQKNTLSSDLSAEASVKEEDLVKEEGTEELKNERAEEPQQTEEPPVTPPVSPKSSDEGGEPSEGEKAE